MAQRDNPFKDWDTRTVDSLALWMPLAAAGLSIVVGVIAFYHAEYLTGTLGIAVALASGAGALASGRASKMRDAQRNFWIETLDHIDRDRG